MTSPSSHRSEMPVLCFSKAVQNVELPIRAAEKQQKLPLVTFWKAACIKATQQASLLLLVNRFICVKKCFLSTFSLGIDKK